MCIYIIYIYSYTYVIYPLERKTFVTATCVVLRDIILSEVSQKRERQILYNLTYTWNLRNLQEQNRASPKARGRG